MAAPGFRLIHLDTAQRDYGSIANPSWNLSGPETKNAKFVSVQTCEFPSSMYNVSSTTNAMQIVNTTDVATYNVTVAPGFYDATTLGTALVTALQAAAALGWSCAFSALTGHFTIANTSAKSFNVVMPASTIGAAMGFSITSATATSVTSNIFASLNTPPYIYISSNSLTSCCLINGRSINVLHKQQCTTAFGAYCIFTAQTSYPRFPVAGNIGTLQLLALDKYLNPVDTNGKDWSISLAIWDN
jgi:hypothetical protein